MEGGGWQNGKDRIWRIGTGGGGRKMCDNTGGGRVMKEREEVCKGKEEEWRKWKKKRIWYRKGRSDVEKSKEKGWRNREKMTDKYEEIS